MEQKHQQQQAIINYCINIKDTSLLAYDTVLVTLGQKGVRRQLARMLRWATSEGAGRLPLSCPVRSRVGTQWEDVDD